MYSKYNCNGKFQISAIKLVSATLFFIHFFLMIKLLKWVTFPISIFATKTSHILASMHLSMFSPRGVGGRTPMGN